LLNISFSRCNLIHSEVYLFLDNNKAGGVDTIVRQLCKYHSVTLIVNTEHLRRVDYRGEKNIKKIIEYNNIIDMFQSLPFFVYRLIRLLYISVDIISDNYLTILHARKQFKKIVLPKNSSLMVVQGGWPASIYGRVALVHYASLVNKTILNIHNISSKNRNSIFGISRKLNNESIEAAKYVLFCSDTAKNSFPVKDSSKCYTVYNGIEFPNLKRLSCKDQTKNLEIGMIGTLEPRKGFEDGIIAYNRLRSKFSLGNLNIFGTGTSIEIIKLRKLVIKLGISDFVIFHGHVDNLEKIYEKLDLVVVPSRAFESFGLIQIESIMHGLPTIVSNHGGLYEVSQIIGNENTFIAEDIDDLINVLQKVLFNYTSELEKIPFIQENIKLNFSVKNMIQKYAKFY
jgi:glycosyltransferase involved in cell wall biosynthesis